MQPIAFLALHVPAVFAARSACEMLEGQCLERNRVPLPQMSCFPDHAKGALFDFGDELVITESAGRRSCHADGATGIGGVLGDLRNRFNESLPDEPDLVGETAETPS